MFYSLTGDIVYRDASSVAVSCGGVAFRCFTSQVTLSQICDKHSVTLYTYLSVKEDSLDLYGFFDETELDFFKMLISITGVGPKAAVAILSVLTPDSLALAIASGDHKAITKAQGVGPRIAQRIVRELKEKIGGISLSQNTREVVSAISPSAVSSAQAEAVEALVMLGYSQSEASSAVSRLDKNLSVEKLITQALKILSVR